MTGMTGCFVSRKLFENQHTHILSLSLKQTQSRTSTNTLKVELHSNTIHLFIRAFCLFVSKAVISNDDIVCMDARYKLSGKFPIQIYLEIQTNIYKKYSGFYYYQCRLQLESINYEHNV